MIDSALQEELGSLGLEFRSPRVVRGGDVCQALRGELADGRSVFLKTLREAPEDLFAAEADGLDWLRVPEGPAVPEVLAAGRTFLMLPWIPPGRANRASEERLGRELAALHRTSPGRFGMDRDTFIGFLPQDNRALPTWAAFYRERRLVPQIERAAPRLDSGLLRRLEGLLPQLEQRVGPEEPPCRLHGDLWSGNLHVDAEGLPWLIDPAAGPGHREIDLAMMQLFGGFSARTFGAYEEAWPTAPGLEERIPLYQLYFLLVHVNLHGPSWGSSVASTLDRLGA